MAVTVKVGTRTVDGYHMPSITIRDVFAPTGDICTLDYVYQPGITILPQVAELLDITFTDTQGTNEKIFLGPIQEVGFRQSPDGHRVQVTAADLTQWLDSKLVAGIFTDATVTVMVASILSTYAPTFDRTTFIDATDPTTILPKSFDWKKVSEALQEIAEEKGYIWWVDFDGKVHFVPKGDTTATAPIAEITPSTDLDVGDFKFTTRTDELKNTIFVKEFFFRSPNLSFEPGEDAFPVSDGDKELPAEKEPTVTLRFEPYDLSEILVEVDEGGGFETYTAREMFTEGDPGTSGGFLAQSAYVDVKGRKITLIHKSGIDTKFAAGSRWRVQYRPLLEPTLPEITVNVHSIIEFADRETGSITNDGEHQYMVSFGSLEFGGTNPIITLIDYIAALLDDFAWPIVEGSFTVFYDGKRDLGKYGWRAGQSFTLLEGLWNLFDWREFYLSGVKKAITVYTKGVTTTVINPEVLRYEISFSSVLSGR